jgi:hypothetical protein
MSAVRSGFPYSVVTASGQPDSGGVILNNRADLISSPRAAADVEGGRRVLSIDAFRQPLGGALGNTGRNAFRAPWFFNIDVSVSRTFSLRALGESGRLSVRASAFNLLNHANLGQPDSELASPTFGVAQYGRRGKQPSFPSLTPFEESARQLQVTLRVDF